MKEKKNDMWQHYKVNPFDEDHTISSPPTEMDKIRESFTDDTPFELNWLFLGTSGIHSWYGTLDDCEEKLKHVGEINEYQELVEAPTITLLIIHPRVCCIQYGNIVIRTQEDIDFLRKYCTKTIQCIVNESQYGNLDKEYRKRFEEKIPERSWI